jgi:hypothetical protein
MPKQRLGIGNKKAVLQRPKTSYTSPRAIKQRQRQAAALDLRLQGHAYHRIGNELHCHPSTAHDLVVKALHKMVPREKAEAVLHLELARLDAMERAIFGDAANGDIPAIDACLRIQHQRARLLGLYPDGKRGGPQVHLNVGSGDAPDAISNGIRVTFVKPDPNDPRYYEPQLEEAKPQPALPKPASPEKGNFGPNILRFEKC